MTGAELVPGGSSKGEDLGVLFSPMDIGGSRAKNRVIRAATSTNLAEGNRVSEKLLAHYRVVAEGGVGTVVTEAMRFHPSSVTSPNSIALTDEDVVPGLRDWSRLVHNAGALMIGQINHSGRQHTNSKVPGGLIGPSPVACPRSGGVPHELTTAEIADFVDYARRAARLLAGGGFDGIEVHCAQGHLLQQFLSPFSNQRDDEYGGSSTARMRFPTEMVEAMRASFDGIVGLRLGVDEFTDGGLTSEMAIEFATSLVERGLVDYLSLSQGNFNTIDTHLPDRHYPEMPFAELQATVKAALPETPVFACTRIFDPAKANALIESGKADAVALCRSLIVDPEWPAKAERGDSARIRYCIACNECWDGLHGGAKTISCVQNPTAGREATHTVAPSVAARRVVVVGGGPAGLQAALTSAERGHDVTLLEKRDSVGGKVALGADLGGHSDLGNVIRYLEAEVTAIGLDVRTGTGATNDLFDELTPDVVVVATGATPISGELVGDGSIVNRAGLPVLSESMAGERIVIVDEDGYYWSAQVAEEASSRGAEVVIVTRFFEPFRELPMVSRIAALRRLHTEGARFLPLHSVVSAHENHLRVEQFESGRRQDIEEVSQLVWVGPQRPNTEPAEMARATGVPEVRVIGDAYAPRRIKNAIYEGFDVGRAI